MHCKLLILASLCAIAFARPQADVSSSEEDMEGKRGRPGRFHNHMPAFLKSASEEAKAELKAIFEDDTLTRKQFDEKLQAWATAQGEAALTAYNNFKTNLQSRMADMKQKIADSSLSETIKAAALQIEEIYNDESLTVKETKEKIKAIFEGLSQEDRVALRQFKRQNKRPKREAEFDAAAMIQMHLPPFLQHATEEAKEAFKKIAEDETLTKQQLSDKFEEWAAQQGEQVKAEFEEEKKKLEELKEKIKQKVAEASVSEEAKAALAKIEALDANMDLTPMDESKQVSSILSELPEEVRNELIKLVHPTAVVDPGMAAVPMPLNV